MTAPTESRLVYDVDENGCWIWGGYVAENGYARVYDRNCKRIVWAHRYSYELAYGLIAPEHEIDHECQVTQCVNPDHLAMVTKAEHVRRTMLRLGKDDLHLAAARLRHLRLTYGEIADVLGYGSRAAAKAAVNAAIAKGLIAADVCPPSPHLTDEDGDDIRAMFTLGIPQTVIGPFYGIDPSQVSRICSGRTARRT